MKKQIFVLLATSLFFIQIQAQELISNPTMRLSIDEDLGEKVFGKIGNMESVLLPMTPKQIQEALQKVSKEQLKEEKGKFRKVKNTHLDFFMIKGWEGREKSDNQNIEIVYLERANEACFRFDLFNYTQFIFTNFKPLEAGKNYKITVGYNFSETPKNHKMKPLDIFLTQKNPEEAKKLKADFHLPFLSNKKDKMADEKRKKIIEEYQKSYGGSFSEDFAQEKEVQQYLTQEFIYKAQGGETYLTIGRLMKEDKKSKQISEDLQCTIYLVSLRPVYSTRDND